MPRRRNIGETVKLGWHIKKSVVEDFRSWCQRERKDPTSELEFLMAEAAKAGIMDPGAWSGPMKKEVLESQRRKPGAKPGVPERE